MTHANRIIGDCPSGWGEVGLEAKQLLHEDVNTSINLLDTTVAALPKQWEPALQASSKKDTKFLEQSAGK